MLERPGRPFAEYGTTCKWPLWTDDTHIDDRRHCGLPRTAESAHYCEEHHRRSLLRYALPGYRERARSARPEPRRKR